MGMTREEAIETLKENLCSMCAYGSQNMESCDIRSCDNRDAIKALEQEPCDDAISRAETIKYLNINMAWYDEDGEIADSDEKLKAITDLINGVPSVTPKQKTGRWIDTDNYYQRWKCSECGCHTRDWALFCPNCGAKMEVEE